MTQPTIKLLLLAAIAVIGWYSVCVGKRVLHRVVWRGFVVRILFAGVLSILFPRGLSLGVHRVGIGLVLYVLAAAFGLVGMTQFRWLDRLEPKYALRDRAFALRGASRYHSGAPRGRR
jgi:hypothetical protein